ncbi:MAG: hypothetical protein ASARMPREDX12_007563 [Alectoria sarmentosa]|nr:MAG: hypothetical protein ASARMPREDX12_007563 [Alectoria sarmentosa]
MPAKTVTPIGTPTPMPILAEVGSLGDAAIELVLDPELAVADRMFELAVVEFMSVEDADTGDLITEVVAIKFVVEGVSAAELVLGTGVTEPADKVVGVGIALSVFDPSTEVVEAELADEKIGELEAAAEIPEGSSVPHVLQVSEPGLVVRH